MDTLVLDAGYTPVARVSWMRAITLLCAGRVEVIEEYEHWVVHSVTLAINVPSVIRLARAVRGRRRAIRFTREQVYARDIGRCQYCGRRVPRPEATYDHVVPRSQGGRTGWENIVISCLGCNQRKGGRTPLQAGMQLLKQPIKPRHLPYSLRITLGNETGTPPSWRAWLRDYGYWNGVLESDEN